MAIEDNPSRPKEVLHDESPSIITDHPFVPRREWWTLCGHEGCGLGEAAHSETTLKVGYYSDYTPEMNE